MVGRAMKCVLEFFVLILFRPAFSINTLSSAFSTNTLLSTESLTISSNRTIASHGFDFELGFFKTASSPRWYLGIWYSNVPQRTYAWVANRDNPLSTPIGTLKISNMNLVLLDHSNNSVWSTNLTNGNFVMRSPVVAELHPNGNFVLRYSNNNDPSRFLWQSFDFPTDTLLPEMKLGYVLNTRVNRVLRSWRSPDDPSSGDFSYKLDTERGLPEFLMWQEDFVKQRSGPWDGIGFSGIPEDRNSNDMVYNFTENSEEIAYTFLMTNYGIYSRLTLNSSGAFTRLKLIPPVYGWIEFWTSPADGCDLYQSCGPDAYCDINTPAVCNCIRGFYPKNQQQWDLRDRSDGCVRTTQLSCNGDGFLRLKNMKLPDTMTATVVRGIGLDKCEERCRRDCNCTSYASMDVQSGVLGCVIWSGQLVDIRNYAAGGQDLYVRLNAADLVAEIEIERNRHGKNIIRWSIGVVSFMLLMCFIILCFWKRRQKRARARN